MTSIRKSSIPKGRETHRVGDGSCTPAAFFYEILGFANVIFDFLPDVIGCDWLADVCTDA